MYKLLIVDDEPVAREGIRDAITWSEIGVKVVGEAANGELAVRAIERLRPDLVLCDVRMPVMDGVALIRTLRETRPSIRVIMLSGYADSEYMREAIRSGVCDYLLKPAGKEQIREAVLRACGSICADREREVEEKARESLISESIETLRAIFFSDLLTGSGGAERLRQRARLLNLDLRGGRYATVLAELGGAAPGPRVAEWERAFEGMSPIVSRIGQAARICALLSLGRRPPEDIPKAIREGRLAESPGHSGVFVVSPPCDSIADLGRHYEKALSLLSRGMWYERGAVLLCDREPVASFPFEECEALERRLTDSIREGDREASLRDFDSLLRLASAAKPELKLAKSIFRRILDSARQQCEGELDPDDGIEETAGGLREHFERLVNLSSAIRSHYGGGSLGRALRYMSRNFSGNLSLESVSSELCISPTYLSRMLNEKTGRGFQGWLIHFRIERAKDLLATTSMKNYDIAEAVGFGSYKLFAEHFREVTGGTAKEYRERRSSGAPEGRGARLGGEAPR